jgi:hypothetical protein
MTDLQTALALFVGAWVAALGTAAYFDHKGWW